VLPVLRRAVVVSLLYIRQVMNARIRLPHLERIMQMGVGPGP